MTALTQERVLVTNKTAGYLISFTIESYCLFNSVEFDEIGLIYIYLILQYTRIPITKVIAAASYISSSHGQCSK